MEAVIEFHGFKDNYNRFIIKELAIVSKHFQCQLIFKSPFSKHLLNSKMARTCRWLTRHYHHIDWDEGDVPFNERLVNTLCKQFATIYTNGLEKAEFLRSFHNNVKEIHCINVNENVDVGCLLSQHSQGKCALRSAKHMYLTIPRV